MPCACCPPSVCICGLLTETDTGSGSGSGTGSGSGSGRVRDKDKVEDTGLGTNPRTPTNTSSVRLQDRLKTRIQLLSSCMTMWGILWMFLLFFVPLGVLSGVFFIGLGGLFYYPCYATRRLLGMERPWSDELNWILGRLCWPMLSGVRCCRRYCGYNSDNDNDNVDVDSKAECMEARDRDNDNNNDNDNKVDGDVDIESGSGLVWI